MMQEQWRENKDVTHKKVAATLFSQDKGIADYFYRFLHFS
jgi:hypothetical protein